MLDFPRPDYAGGSLVNLMSSLRTALGGTQTLYPPLVGLNPTSLSSARRVVLLIIDGLGYDYLTRQTPDGHLRRHLRGSIDSVFPTTTASAVTSLATGVGPQQHAITGWFMWLRELGMVTSILPFRSRAGHLDLMRAGLDVGDILGAPAFADSIHCPSAVLSPQRIVDSAFSRASTGTAARNGYSDLEDFFVQLTALILAADGPGYIHAYWPEFDALAHVKGVSSPAVQQHFEAFDQAFGAFLTAISGSGTCVLVTADHGFIDTGPEHYVQLADHPELAACLRLPLCGEPRAAYCYVRPQQRTAFEHYAAEALTPYCDCIPSAELIEAGYFGLGPAHPQLIERVGDYVLLFKEHYVIKDYVAGERPFYFAGVHSGLSDAELRVPWIQIET